MTNDKQTEPNADSSRDHAGSAGAARRRRLAYVKTIRSEDVARLFPQAPQIAPGIKLFALHAADGTPIMLTDTREAAVANAWSQELEASQRARYPRCRAGRIGERILRKFDAGYAALLAGGIASTA